MRVLCGGPAREIESVMFQAHVESLEAQATSGLEVEVRHELVPDKFAPHDWFHEKIEAVAKARQGFLDCADAPVVVRGPIPSFNQGYDGLLMVDTDVILGPGVLERMWAVDADVVYGVFWTKANWGSPEESDVWPQVWSHHPYNFDEQTWSALVERGVNEVPVRGGGACTLIRGRGFESRYHPLLDSLKYAGGMWAGEDRSYCLGLEARGIKQVAVTGLPIIHLYDDEHRTPEMVEKARQSVGLGMRIAN